MSAQTGSHDPDRPQDPNLNALWARAILEELVRAGVRHVCISPGSRSTPLTLAAASHPRLRAHSHIDERCAAFFALGLGKATGAPAALICTSGTAGAHYYPAILEAAHARVPLIALTADRPFELQGTGAGQTMEQKELFGRHVRMHLHLERPDVTGQALRHVRVCVDRACAAAMGRTGANAPGPVHINVPFREPLAPLPRPGQIPKNLLEDEPLGALGREQAPLVTISREPAPPAEADVEVLVEALRQARRPVIVCGPAEPIHGHIGAAAIALARAAGAPLLADPASGARRAPGAAGVAGSCQDAYLRSEPWRATHAPDLVVRLGAQPTSKVYRFWREQHPQATEILIDPFGQLLDQPQQAARLITAAPEPLCQRVAARHERPGCDPEWRQAFVRAERVADEALEAALAEAGDSLWEGAIARDVAEALPAEAALFAASSMPIRDLDTFARASDTPLEVLANRGVNGIDGLISTAMGVAAASARPCALLIGDVAFLHDVGGLLAASRGFDPRSPEPDLTVVLVHNGGGGIFEHLPIAGISAPGVPEHYERHFLTTHEVDFASVCRGYGVAHHLIEGRRALQDALAGCIGRPGVQVLEARVDLEENLARHRRAWDAVAAAL